MKFIHLGDTHIGKVYKDEKRNEDLRKMFELFVDKAIEIKPDFIIHSGDLFNEGFPRISDLLFVTDQLFRLKEAGIRVFAIPGSHDVGYGEENSIIELFHRNGLLTNLNSKQYLEEKEKEIILKGETYKNAFIAGIKGKRTRASEDIFKKLKVEIDKNAWIKIFVFHHTISSLGEVYKDIDTEELPKGFDYYAAGHWHGHKGGIKYGNGIINYPGSLEYCDAFEIENYNERGFYLVEYNEKGIQKIDYVTLPTREKEIIHVNALGKKGIDIANEILRQLSRNSGKLLVIKIFGKMNGLKSEIDVEKIKNIALSLGYSYVNINTSDLQDANANENKIEITERRIDNIEEEFLRKRGYNDNEIKIAKLLINSAENMEDVKLLLNKLLTYDN